MKSWLSRANRGLRAGVMAVLVLAGSASPARTNPTPGAAPPASNCPTNEVIEQVRSDRHRYRVGQSVTIKVVATNISRHDCLLPSTVQATVDDATGTAVFGSAANILWIPEARWHPGQSLSWSFTWDQHAAPGRYLASGSWDSYRPASTSFVIGR